MLPPEPTLEAPIQANKVPMAACKHFTISKTNPRLWPNVWHPDYLSLSILFVLLSIGLLNLAPDPDEVRRQNQEYKEDFYRSLSGQRDHVDVTQP